MNFRLGELFCGPGGIAVGARNSSIVHNGVNYSITHEWANDYDKDTCETYARNICPENMESVICEDVRKLDIKSLKAIDCFAYGFPCNDFSIVGEQKGFAGTFGPLYTYGIKVLNHFRPKFFIAENVGGLASANSGSAFVKILEDLRNAGNGYVLTPHLYKSEDYNVPQTRHRIIIVGIDRTLNKRFKVPKHTSLNKPITAKEAIENPPIPADAFNNEIIVPSSKVVERLKLIKAGENVWNANLPSHLQLNVKNTKMSQIYKRLHPDKPSYTITGSGGGGTHGYHWTENRALTNRERARIQTFPDNHKFYGSKESVRKQIGMAVPAKLSEIIFNSILKTMLDIPYEYIEEKYKQVNEIFENELI
jgi:DNA (cytosine-5)-methyltransferase 1